MFVAENTNIGKVKPQYISPKCKKNDKYTKYKTRSLSWR